MKEHTDQLSRTAYRNQLKEHKKLYKSGKNWMAATLLTVGLAGGAMLAGTTTANADVVTPAQSAQAQQASTQDTELAKTQSDAQVQQNTINNANTQLSNQQSQLSDAQGQQSQAQQELDQAKQAQQSATANDPAVKQAQQAVNQAQQQVNDQQTVVDQAQTTVNNDKQNVQSAANAVSQASQNVDQARQTAKDAIDQTVDQQTNEAQNKIDQLENQGKAQASQNLDNQINNVSGQVSDAQNDVNNTNSQISDLQGQVKDLQDQEKDTQTDPNIKTVPNGVIDYSKSLLENASRNNLWQSNDLTKNNDNIIPQNIYVSPDNDKGASNPYAGIMADPSLSAYDNYFTTNFDGVNGQMTNPQKQELAILLMNEINHAREQRGLKPFTMTEQKFNQAQVRASQQSAQSLTHSESNIESAFGQDQYECLAYIPVRGSGNMLGMLFNASNTLSNMLNADASSDWGHRENFLEDTGDENYDAAFGFHLTDDGQYYVLTFDYDGPARNNTPNMMDRIAQYQAMGPITGDTNKVDNSAKINDLNNQIDNLQNTLSSQQSHLNDLQTQLQNLQAQKANVQFDLNQLSSDQQAEYNKAKNTLATANGWKNDQLSHLDSNSNVQDALNNLQSAQATLASAKNTQTQDEAKLQQAKDGLANLNQVLADKNNALDTAEQNANASANQAVKDAQARLDTINGKIADLQNAIEATKLTISNAQAQLDKDNQKIADIKNGQKPATPTDPAKPSNPSKGDDKPTDPSTPANPTKPSDPNKGDDHKGSDITNPTTPTKPSDGNKDHNTTPAEPSKPNKSDDNKGGETPAQPTNPAKPNTGNASIAGQADHKPAKDNGSVTTGSDTTKNNTNKPTIVLPTTGSESATNAGEHGQYINITSDNNDVEMTREQYKAQQAQLPQTGNENSKAVIALGVLGGMFGLGLAAKNKKEF